ncbi:MAG: hypothetical protein C0602_08745 [Denitrovibrio sp.]|nr:MAG: hypothetical protein C0602_08745 [Denitrovibrio sp.]
MKAKWLLLIIICLMTVGCGSEKTTIMEYYYSQLDNIRETKYSELTSYLDNVRSNAKAVENDESMKTYFTDKYALYAEHKKTGYEEEDYEKLFSLRNSIENRYIEKYLIFHDVLFIHSEGDIFYTVKRDDDYHKNIFEGELANTRLSEVLKGEKPEAFVDYDYYFVNGDVFAFFVEPVIINGKQAGWFVFQFGINKINSIFSKDDVLGKTGEVFLVNKDAVMLTDSKFVANSTILNKHLSQENISQKFEEVQGHKVVIDYRGREAVTSFKVVTVMGNDWLLIAKIDRDEILTEDYRKQEKNIWKDFLMQVEKTKMEYPSEEYDFAQNISVDIDEFKRASDGEILYTHGVSYCTVVIISLKGEFAYMGHISAYDKMYGGIQTDILTRVLDRIDNFDLLDYKKRDVEVRVVSPRIMFSENVVNTLLDWGVLLPQIKIATNEDARYVSLYHDYENGKTFTEWHYNSRVNNLRTNLTKVENLLEIYEQHYSRM